MSDPYAAIAKVDPYGHIATPADQIGTMEDMARSALAHLTHLGASVGAGLGDVPAMAQSAAAAGQHLGEAITGHKAGTDFGKTAGDVAAAVLNTFGLTPQSSIVQPGGRPVDRAVQALVVQKAAQAAGQPQAAAQAGAMARRTITSRGPTSSQVADAAPGGSYRAQTLPGKVTGALVDFSPALIGSEGTIPQRLGQWVAPALASEGAGALTEGTPWEQPARFGAAVLAGGMVAPRTAAGAAPAEELSTPERRVGAAFNRAMKRDSLSPDDLRTFAADNPGAATFHVGGPNVASLAEVAAQSPGSAQRTIRTAVLDDQAAAPRQAADMIGESLGGKGDYFAHLDEALKARSDAAKKGMGDIGHHLVTLDHDSVQALRSDLATSAIRTAAKNYLASPETDVRDMGARLNRLADDLLDKPSAITIDVRSAQDISKSLLKAADQAYRTGDGGAGEALKGLGRAVRTNAATPERGGFTEYRDWLARYGNDSDHIDALKLGRDVFSGSQGVSAEQIKRELADMPTTALDYYKKGVGEAVLDKVRKGGVVGLRQALKDEYGDRIRLAFPDEDSFQGFQQNLEGLLERHGRNNTIIGNSRTFARGAAAEDLNKQHGVDPAEVVGAGIDVGMGNLSGLASAGAKHLLKVLPKKDQSIIGDAKASEVLGKVLTDPQEADRILRLYQSRRGPPSVAAVAGRAVRPTVLLPAAIAARQGQ